MATDSMRATLDRLKTNSDKSRDAARSAADASTSALNPLGLRFPLGARVIDTATGQEGVIETQHPAQGQLVEAYTLRLQRTGGLAVRAVDELEPIKTPPPAGR